MYSDFKKLSNAYSNLEKLANDIYVVSGFTLNQLKEMFLAGYTLKKPEKHDINELVEILNDIKMVMVDCSKEN